MAGLRLQELLLGRYVVTRCRGSSTVVSACGRKVRAQKNKAGVQ